MEKSQSGGDRKYRIKTETLSKLGEKKLSDFETHLLQEGVKQVLFAQGSEQFISEETGYQNCYNYLAIPKEMIRFLKDHDLIEECKFD